MPFVKISISVSNAFLIVGTSGYITEAGTFFLA